MKYLVRFVLCFITLSCQQEKQRDASSEVEGRLIPLRYAKGFSILKKDDFTLVEVKQPFQGAKKGYQYLLLSESQQVPEGYESAKVIRTPIKSIVCTSTTHIPLLDYLDETHKLIGFPTTDYISSSTARALIDAGKVKDLGIDKGLNLEQLVSIKPAMVMGYTMSADYGQFKKIEDLGIPVVLNSEYLEAHPLGRAEWIKFMAAFFNKDHKADSIFRSIEKNYNETAELVKDATARPTVISGIMYGDAWFLPGGQNYASKILKDAGCKYLWEDDSTNGYLELSFETVYNKGYQADLWIGVGPYGSMQELAAGDQRYTTFTPYVNKTIYNYDLRKGSKGGNEFLELGYLRPDIILRDLVKIAHPSMLADHELFFHRRLP